MSNSIHKAIFPVGGLGTRFLPATKAMPKEMLAVVDKPLIQYALEEAQEAGIEEFIFISSRGKSSMADHFDHSFELENTLRERGKLKQLESITSWLPKPGQVCMVRQQDPLGLGHAVWCARHLIGDDPFAVLLADDLIHGPTGALKQMIDVYERVGGNLVAVQEVPSEQTNRYGILDVTEDKGNLVRAKGVVEKPEAEKAPSNIAIVGRYILQPSVMDALAVQHKDARGEIQLTDAIDRTAKQVTLHGVRFNGQRFDCGAKEGFIQANLTLALDHPELGPRVRELIKDML